MNMSETTSHGLTCNCGETFQSPVAIQTHIQAHELSRFDGHEARQPTEDEVAALIDYYRDVAGFGQDEIEHCIEGAYHVVIEGYTTGCPGYAGRILIEIGSAAPSFYTAYRWEDDGWTRMRRAEEVRSIDTAEGDA
jgi:hypothetical protein